MNIQIKIHVLALLTVTYLQSMEPEVLTLNSRVIRTFIKVNTDNKFHIPGFSRQRDRIILLQQLADQGSHITFSSKDKEVPSWLHKDIDATQKTLYKLFSFLRYNKNSNQIAVKYTCSEKTENFTHVLCLNNDALWITVKKSIKNGQKGISDLYDEYTYNNETTHAAQPDPDQNSIDAWHRYLQAVKNGMDTIKPIKPLISMGTVLRDQGIFKLTNSLIGELMSITKETTYTTSTHSRTRLKKLKLLNQLVKEEIDITFNNEDLTCLIKDTKTFKKTFYNKFFLFLDYNNSTCQAATYNTSLRNPKKFMATISLNNSLLHMVGSKHLSSNREQKIEKFIAKYRSTTTEHIDTIIDIVKAEEQPYFAPSFSESYGGHGEASFDPAFAEASVGKRAFTTKQSRSIRMSGGKPTEVTIEIQEEPQKKLTIEGEVVELNDFDLACIVLQHKENNVVQRLKTLAEVHKITKQLKM